MRNYVLINNSSSLNKAGLAISELPPITKPLMRSLVEEIDGKDGDIVTKLGYSAYDKEMTIGLYPGYDINAIISFFNQSGKITFSNEPDKYYNFEILEQIDYEALLKFKTAVVTFHCQPFKYPISETAITTTAVNTDITVNNLGNYFAKPTITIVGNGTVNVYLGSTQIFSVEVSGTVVIDTTNLEAYNPSTLELMNRNVTGNISNLKIDPGNNTMKFTGDLTSATISNYTRWL